MFEVLIVEDDNFKKEALVDLIGSNVPNARIQCVADVSTAVAAINQSKFHLIIIDMALPSHPVVSGGGSPMSLLTGGLEVLLELNSLERTDHCIIVTQYPDIEIAGNFYALDAATAAIRENLSCNVIGCFQYAENSSDWSEALLRVLNTI